MTSKLLKTLAIAVTLGFSATVFADPILIDDTDAGTDNGTDVGLTDLVEGSTTKNIGGLDAAGDCGAGNSTAPEYEECWAENVLGMDLDFAGKNEPVETFSTSVDGVIAFALEYGPGYYIIKNATAWVLMMNRDSQDWGVLDLGDLPSDGFGNLKDGVVISHVSELNGDGDMKMPEPGTLGLLGLGLLGLGVARRRRESA